MKIYDLTSSVNPFGPSKKIRNTLRRAIKKVNTGDEREKSLLKRYIAIREGVNEEQIAFFSSLSFFLRSFFDEYSIRSVGIIPPMSKRLEHILERVKSVMNDRVLIKFIKGKDDIKQRNDGPDLLFFVYPHDVLGLNVDLDMESLLSCARENNRQMIIDETFKEFAEIKTICPNLTGEDGFLVLRGLSEFLGLGGLPFFCVLGSEDTIRRIEPHLSLEEIPYLVYQVVRVGLKDKRFKERTILQIKEEKAYIMEKARRIKDLILEDTGCNFILLKSAYIGEYIENQLRKKGLMVEVYRDEQGMPYLWFPLKKRKFNALFIKTLKSIIEEVKSLHGE